MWILQARRWNIWLEAKKAMKDREELYIDNAKAKTTHSINIISSTSDAIYDPIRSPLICVVIQSISVRHISRFLLAILLLVKDFPSWLVPLKIFIRSHPFYYAV